MKLSRFDSITNAEKGVDYEIPDPITGLPSGMVWTLLGSDSKVYKGALDEIIKRNRASKGMATISDDDSIEIISRCVTRWKGMEDDNGKEIPFSQAKAREILAGYPYISQRVSTFITMREGFFQKP